MKDFSQIPSPCYVLEEEAFKRNLQLIRTVGERAGAKIIMSFKAFAMWKVFPLVRAYVSGVSVSSLNEARLGFDEMNAKGHLYAPAYDDKNIEKYIPFISHISFNSFSQAEKYAGFVKKKNADIQIGIRVNPEYSNVSVDLYNPALPDSRLGVLCEHMPETLPEYVDGLHFHALCESSSFALEETLRAMESPFAKYLHQIKWVNMGGGHLITKEGYDIEHLIQVIRNFKEKYNVEVILEPGSAFAWQAGYLVSTVLDIVKGRNIETAILDVSFTCHMPDCLEMPYKPEVMNATEPAEGKPAYRLGGNSCLAGDYIGEWSFENLLKIGDKIVFKDMMHYTMVKTTMFNGVAHPSIGMVDTLGKFRLLKKFGYDDYKNRMS